MPVISAVFAIKGRSLWSRVLRTPSAGTRWPLGWGEVAEHVNDCVGRTRAVEDAERPAAQLDHGEVWHRPARHPVQIRRGRLHGSGWVSGEVARCGGVRRGEVENRPGCSHRHGALSLDRNADI